MVNVFLSSCSGLTWQKQDLNNEDYLCRMVYGNGVVIAAPLDGAYVYYTVDGINWGFSQALYSPSPPGQLKLILTPL